MGEQIQGHPIIGEIVDWCRRALSHWADRQKGEHLPGFDPETGVAVVYSRKRNGIIRFALVTEDDYLIAVDVDVNQASRAYFADMIRGVRDDIEQRREADRPIILLRS
ncbi:MAG: hypothetical protein ACOCZ7_00155 [Armatimonadota bacterium]